jgi:hypothetical protein
LLANGQLNGRHAWLTGSVWTRKMAGGCFLLSFTPHLLRRKRIYRNKQLQYHLSTGTLSPTSESVGYLPMPTSIIYHVYTCCFREYWLVVLFSFSVIVLLEIIIIPFTLKHFVPFFVCLLVSSLLPPACRNKGHAFFLRTKEQRAC